MEKKQFFIMAIVFAVLALLYWLLPVDLLPDFITGIGRLDDVFFGLAGFMSSIISFFIGLGTGVQLSKVKNEQIQWNEDFKQTYGSYMEL